MSFLIIAIFFWAALLSYFTLDAIIPENTKCRKVGGLLHWRCGRLGGSFYLAKR